jgi:DNA repair protein RadA/Sms
VSGTVVLVGGEPGVGKSTLLLQAAGRLAEGGSKVMLATAEESADQVGLRADRLGIDSKDVYVVADHDIDVVLTAADQLEVGLLVIDSIQTVAAAEADGSPGGVAQVRECAARAIRFAKSRSVPTILIGHVTKDGGLAGPKLLEHMVDVVLYLEGDTDHGLRILRSFKNRFGPTHLAALFEMQHDGLSELADPSRAFVADWNGGVPGTVLFPAVEGRRSMLVEVQALIGPSSTLHPRRSVRGLDQARVLQLLAVLERHAGLKLSDREAYVSIVGGLRVTEPAADLPAALALASSLRDRSLGPLAAWGEVGLTGQIRSVPHNARRREAVERLAIPGVITPNGGGPTRIATALELAGLIP